MLENLQLVKYTNDFLFLDCLFIHHEEQSIFFLLLLQSGSSFSCRPCLNRGTCRKELFKSNLNHSHSCHDFCNQTNEGLRRFDVYHRRIPWLCMHGSGQAYLHQVGLDEIVSFYQFAHNSFCVSARIEF